MPRGPRAGCRKDAARAAAAHEGPRTCVGRACAEPGRVDRDVDRDHLRPQRQHLGEGDVRRDLDVAAGVERDRHPALPVAVDSGHQHARLDLRLRLGACGVAGSRRGAGTELRKPSSTRRASATFIASGLSSGTSATAFPSAFLSTTVPDFVPSAAWLNSSDRSSRASWSARLIGSSRSSRMPER